MVGHPRNLLPFAAPARRRLGAAFAALLLAAGLAGCGGGGGDSGTPGPGEPPFGNNGTLRVLLTDAPACGYDSVHVTVQKVRVHQSATAAETAAGWSEIALTPARRIDLLSLTNGVLTELGQTTLPPGRYTQMRLQLADIDSAQPMANAVKFTGGSEVALKTPSGQQSGLKLDTAIDVAAGQRADVVLDFDACKSVVRAGSSGNVLLKPVVRVTPYYVSGVQGQVEAALIGPLTMLSLQQSGLIVKATVPDATGRFVLAPAAPGSYQLVLSAPGRTTVVVNNVVIATESVTAVGSAAVPLAAPASPTATLAGAVATGAATIDATVHAQQTLAGGALIEVAGAAVDASNGAYALAVPTAAPLVAPYLPAPAPLVFTADTTAAGRYRLAARSGTVEKAAGPFTLAPGATVSTPFSFP